MSVLHPDLNFGVTIACFQSDGNLLIEIKELYIRDSGMDNSVTSSCSKIFGYLSGP
jgi:hypothetical protein